MNKPNIANFLGINQQEQEQEQETIQEKYEIVESITQEDLKEYEYLLQKEEEKENEQ